MTCLHAAVRAGADAVYLGAQQFNARRGAGNFSLDDLAQACDFAHLRGVRIYLTVNTIVLPSELSEALELVRQAWRAGVDAFIVQDVGFASTLHAQLPQAEIHASTQMNTHSSAGLHALHKMGFDRVTFARELGIVELACLSAEAHELGMSVEAFAHGALCICYSGQCFASSMLGGRSANRGMCAQACRLPYELLDGSVVHRSAERAEHLLSPKDLCTIDMVPELVEAGVDSFKIEGRMKSPEYVHAVVGTYRSVIDRALAWGQDEGSQEPPRSTQQEQTTLSEAFSRGFTQAYLAGKTDMGMMSTSRPNNRGVRVGRVAQVRDGKVHVEVDRNVELACGDVVEFWTGAGHPTHTIGAGDVIEGSRASLQVKSPVGKGDRVFRVRSASAAFEDDPYEPKVALSGTVCLRIGAPAAIELAAVDPRTGEDIAAAVAGDVVEPARTKALAVDDVRAHVDRLGGTPFELAHLDVQLDEGAGMGFGALHALRAQAVEQLQERMLQPWRDRVLPKVSKDKRATARRMPMPARDDMVVYALASNAACARAARKAGAHQVVVPALNYKRGQGMVSGQLSDTVEQAGYPNRAAVVLPVANHDPVPGTREEKFAFDPWKYVKPGKPVIAENLGDVQQALEMGALVEVGPHVPVTNAAAARMLAAWGVARIWLSPELTLGQIQRIAEEADVPLGLTVIGQQELMVTEHCLLQSQGPCNQDCTACPRRKSAHFLRDRKGYQMPVATDCLGRSHLYNAVAFDVAHALPDVAMAGVSAFMVDTTLMNTKQTAEAVERAVRACNLARTGKGAVSRATGTTTGHLFRAIE